VGGQAISNLALGRSNSELGYGGLVLSASSESVSVLIRALQEAKRAEVLGRPQIMTRDMVQARILVGQIAQIPSGTSTTNFGSVNTDTEEKEVGLSLTVLPQIGPDGQVSMEILTERSQLDEENGTTIGVSDLGIPIIAPVIDIVQTETTVIAMDGQTVILSGLITKDQVEVHRQVPCLGDIPVLGHLFRYDGVEERREELLIILTPHIIDSDEDLELAKQTEAARMHWCYANVLDVHGEIFDRSEHMPVIYPDLDPAGRGIVPPEMIPAPAGAPVPTDASPFMVEPPAPDPGDAAEASKLRVRPSPQTEAPSANPNPARPTAGPRGQQRPGPIQPFQGQPGPDPRSPLAEAERADYEFRFDPSLEAAPTSWTRR
jgi:hypothetical protein